MMTEPPKTHQPRPRRLPVQISITSSTVDVFLDSQIMNLSKGGVFVRADITLPLGSEVDFTFTLPESDRVVQASGVVVWSRKAGKKPSESFPEHPPGMGIQFRKIDMEDLEFLLDEIERLVKEE